MNQAPQISFNKERDNFHVEKKWDMRERDQRIYNLRQYTSIGNLWADNGKTKRSVSVTSWL